MQKNKGQGLEEDMPDFNKLQNISNFKSIAKEVAKEVNDDGGYMDEEFEDEYL